MICERMFRLKKNGEPYWDCYCRHPELIENYDKAIADKTQTWEVHHRLECCFTYKFLKDMNLYYDVEPEALIFLTREEHRKIDSKCKRVGEAMKGRKKPEGSGVPPKKVLCVETGEVFESTMEVERKTGIGNGRISAVCLGKHKTTGGYHWRYV